MTSGSASRMVGAIFFIASYLPHTAGPLRTARAVLIEILGGTSQCISVSHTVLFEGMINPHFARDFSAMRSPSPPRGTSRRGRVDA